MNMISKLFEYRKWMTKLSKQKSRTKENKGRTKKQERRTRAKEKDLTKRGRHIMTPDCPLEGGRELT